MSGRLDGGQSATEHRLQAREEQLRLVVESITDYGICQIGLDGMILAFNRGAELKTGYARDEVIGRPLSVLYQPEDAADGIPDRLLRQAIVTGRSEWEGWRVGKGGSRYFDNEVFTAVRVGGAPVGIVKITRDRTDELKRETALRARDERYRLVLRATNEVIYDWEVATGAVVWGGAAASAFGYSDEELGDDYQSWRERIHPDDREAIIAGVQRALDGGAPDWQGSYRFRTASGDYVTVLDRGSVLRDDAGRAIRLVGAIQDITARARRDVELRAATTAAEAANRAKSDFLAQMSHELRTPLNSVIGFANVLRRNEGNRLHHKDLEHLDRIRQNALQLLGVIDGILDLSKVEARTVDVRREPVALASLIKDTVAQVEGVRRDGVTLRVDLPASPVHSVLTDADKLRQVLINLLSNALRFTEQGHVLVRLVARDGHPERIDVIDTGIGIPHERQQAVFEPFEQAESGTARSYGGTGLGLAIATELCERLGFTLSVQSEPGRGSAFAIHLGSAQQQGRFAP